MQKRFPEMGSEKDSEYEAYGPYGLNSHGGYASPYTQRDNNATGCEEGFKMMNYESLFTTDIWTLDSRVHHLKTLLSKNTKMNTMNMGDIMPNIKNIPIVDER